MAKQHLLLELRFLFDLFFCQDAHMYGLWLNEWAYPWAPWPESAETNNQEGQRKKKQQQLPQLWQQLACQAIKMQKLPLTQAKGGRKWRKSQGSQGGFRGVKIGEVFKRH